MEITINPWLACVASSAIAGFLGWLITELRYRDAYSYIEIEDSMEDLGKTLIAASREGKTEFSIEVIDGNCSIVIVDERARLENLMRN